MTDQIQTTRICSACGMEKPLFAFLESGYICADCRQVGSGDQSDDGTTRLQLDHKARMQIELEKIDRLKHLTDLESQEKTKKEVAVQEKSEKTELLERTEKQLREEYLDSQKQEPFPSIKTKTAQQKSTAFQNRQEILQAIAGKKNWAEKSQALQSHEIAEKIGAEETRKANVDDVSLVNAGEQLGGTAKRSSETFLRFRELLGESAAINRTLTLYGEKTVPTAQVSKNTFGFLTQNQGQQPSSSEPVVNNEKSLAPQFLNTRKPRS